MVNIFSLVILYQRCTKYRDARSRYRKIVYLRYCMYATQLYSDLGTTLTVDSITSFFKRRYKSEDLEDVFGEESDFDVGRRVAKEFVEKGGFKTMPQVVKWLPKKPSYTR